MKLYYDNSTDLIQKSKIHRNVITISYVTAAIGGVAFLILGIIVACTVLSGDPNKVQSAHAHRYACALLVNEVTTIISIAVCAFYYFCYDHPAINNDRLLLVADDIKNTLAIFQSGQTMPYLDNQRYAYRCCKSTQQVDMEYTFSYHPHSSAKEWSKRVSKVANTKISSKCQINFKLSFVINPQSLTNEGRDLLYNHFFLDEDLQDSLQAWLFKRLKVEKGGIVTVPQNYLYNNPYGFQCVRIRHLSASHKADHFITAK